MAEDKLQSQHRLKYRGFLKGKSKPGLSASNANISPTKLDGWNAFGCEAVHWMICRLFGVFN